MASNSIKSRLAALQAIAAQKRGGPAIMALLEDGTWSVCKGPNRPSGVFPTEATARAYLEECENIIIIDV